MNLWWTLDEPSMSLLWTLIQPLFSLVKPLILGYLLCCPWSESEIFLIFPNSIGHSCRTQTLHKCANIVWRTISHVVHLQSFHVNFSPVFHFLHWHLLLKSSVVVASIFILGRNLHPSFTRYRREIIDQNMPRGVKRHHHFCLVNNSFLIIKMTPSWDRQVVKIVENGRAHQSAFIFQSCHVRGAC